MAKTGDWVIRSLDMGEEVRRIETDVPVNSTSWERTQLGLLQKIDSDRFYLGWEGIED